MARRRFSKPPTLGSKSRAPNKAVAGQLSSKLQEFKDTYIFERRMLERFRNGDSPLYTPSPSLDGKSIWDTPEEKKNATSVWGSTYNKVKELKGNIDPCHYLRILFHILRGSTISIPTVAQVASPKMLELIDDFMKSRKLELRQQFVAQNQRAQSAIRINQKGAGYPLSLSVYYAIVDNRLGLSPLFQYCLATETVKQIKASGTDGDDCDKLERLAKKFEMFAVMDYTLFPDEYDEVWGTVIPVGFRANACNLIKAAIGQ